MKTLIHHTAAMGKIAKQPGPRLKILLSSHTMLHIRHILQMHAYTYIQTCTCTHTHTHTRRHACMHTNAHSVSQSGSQSFSHSCIHPPAHPSTRPPSVHPSTARSPHLEHIASFYAVCHSSPKLSSSFLGLPYRILKINQQKGTT